MKSWYQSKVSLVTLGLGAAVVVILAWRFLGSKSEYPGVPKQAVALVKQGDAELAQKNLEKALDLYLKAVDLDATFSLAHAKAAEAYVFASIQHKTTRNQSMQDEMIKQANLYLTKALEANPSEGYAYYVQGLIAAEANTVDPAIEKFETAERLGVSTYALHSNLGFLYNQKSETAKCIDQYQKALRHRSDDVSTLFNLGELYFAVGNYGKATEYYGDLARIQPDLQANRVNYAVALWKDGSDQKAKTLLNQILESSQGSKFRNYNTVAWALIDKDVDYEWGIKLAHAAEEMKRNNIESIDILGWGYFKAKDYTKAVEYLSRSMKYKPSEEVKRRLDQAKEKLKESGQ